MHVDAAHELEPRPGPASQHLADLRSQRVTPGQRDVRIEIDAAVAPACSSRACRAVSSGSFHAAIYCVTIFVIASFSMSAPVLPCIPRTIEAGNTSRVSQ